MLLKIIESRIYNPDLFSVQLTSKSEWKRTRASSSWILSTYEWVIGRLHITEYDCVEQ